MLFALLIDRRLLALMLVCGAVACTLPFVRSRIGYLFTPQFADSNARGGRAKRWATAIGYLKTTDPVFGMGYGMYGGAVAVQNPVLPWVEYMYVDNYYVKILTENGIVGVTAFGMMLLASSATACAPVCARQRPAGRRFARACCAASSACSSTACLRASGRSPI